MLSKLYLMIGSHERINPSHQNQFSARSPATIYGLFIYAGAANLQRADYQTRFNSGIGWREKIG